MDDDSRQQFAKRLDGFLIAPERLRVEGAGQVSHLFAVAGNRRRMQHDIFGRRVRPFQFGFQFAAFCPKFRQPVFDLIPFGEALHIGLIDTFPFAGCLRQPPFNARPAGDQIGGKALAFGVIRRDVFRDQSGVSEIGFQAIEHHAFDDPEMIGAAMIAGTGFLHAAALDTHLAVPLVLHGHAGTAAAAFEQA